MLQTLQKVRILGAILVLLCCNSAIRFGRALSPQSLLSNVVSSASTSTGVTINAARIPQDLQAIEVCRAVAFADKPQLMRSDQDFISAKQAQKDPLVTCLVARNGNRIVGTADCRLNEKTGKAFVNNVFVLPDQRGNGIGRRLMTEGVEKLVESSCDQSIEKITLTVATQNKPAFNLYKSLGYVPDGPANSLVVAISEGTGANLQVEMYKIL